MPEHRDLNKLQNAYLEIYLYSSIQLVFLWKVVRQNDTDVTSFCMQFEKLGPGLLREALFIIIARVFTAFSRTDPFPPLFWLTTHSPSLLKASRSNLHPTFLKSTQNDVTSVSFCLTTSSKKNNCKLLLCPDSNALA